MADGGLPIPETGKILQGPGVIDGDQYSNARAWGQIAAAGERLQDVSAKAAHQLIVGAVADQELEIRRKQLELHDQFANNPEGFDAAWKGYSDGKLAETPRWMVDQLRRKLGSEGNAAYGAILGTRRSEDMRQAGEKQSALVAQTASDVVGSAMAGNIYTPDGKIKIAKYRAVLDAGVTADLHTQEWSDLHFDDTMSKASGEVAARDGVKVYHDEGFEKAVEHLRKNILENENLTLKGEGRYRAFSRGLQAIRLEQQADKADRTEIIQSSTDLRARINSRQQYDEAEVRDTLGALRTAGAASEYAKLSKDHAVAQAAAPLYAGMRPAEGAQLVAGMRVSVAQARGLSPEITGKIDEAAKAAGISTPLFRRMAQLESSGDPSQVTGTFKGLFQLSDAEFKRYGGTNIMDAGENARVAALKIRDEIAAFRSANGRDPSPTEIYLQHQQGVGGLAAHLANPNAAAWQNMRSTGEARDIAEGRQKFRGETGPAAADRWARAAVWGNVPDDLKGRYGSVDNISSAQFTDLWKRKVEGETGEPEAPAAVEFKGEITKRVQALWIADQKKAWPAFKTKIDQGQVLDEDDFAAIRYASALSNDPHWAKEVDVLYRANKVGIVAKTEGWSESQRQDVLNEVRAKSVAEGWGVEEGPLLDSLDKQFKRQNTLIREDPVQFHIESSGAPPPPLNVANSPAFRAGLMSRSRIASTVAKDQGIPPGSALMETELPSVKAALDAADPAGKARIFADLAAGIPDEKVLAATMHKLGGDAPHNMVQVFAGMIQRQDPRIAQSILRGQQAIKADKRNDPLQEGEKKDVFNAALDAALPEGAFSLAGRTNPLGSYATMRNATIARYADLTAQDPNSKHEFSEERLKQAANDVTGGVLRFNGGNLIAPKRGMTQGNFDGIMYGLTDADLAGVGTPGGQIITADYMRQNGHLEAVGDGLYLVKFGAEGPNKMPTYAQRFDVSGESSPFLLDLKDREPSKIKSNFVGYSPAGLAAGGIVSLGQKARDWWQQGGSTAVEDGVKKLSEDARPAWDYFVNLGTDIANAISTEAEAAPRVRTGPGMPRGLNIHGMPAWSAERRALYETMVKQGAKTQDIVAKTEMPETVIRDLMERRALAIASMWTLPEHSELIKLFQTRRATTDISQAELIRFTESLPPHDLTRVMREDSMNEANYSVFLGYLARQTAIDFGPKGVDILRSLHPEILKKAYTIDPEDLGQGVATTKSGKTIKSLDLAPAKRAIMPREPGAEPPPVVEPEPGPPAGPPGVWDEIKSMGRDLTQPAKDLYRDIRGKTPPPEPAGEPRTRYPSDNLANPRKPSEEDLQLLRMLKVRPRKPE